MTHHRFTALFSIETRNSAQYLLDRRPFIGSEQEALDDLKAEYDEHFPANNFNRIIGGDEPNFRGDKFWQQKLLAIRKFGKCAVVGQDKQMGVLKIFTLERTSAFTREEISD